MMWRGFQLAFFFFLALCVFWDAAVPRRNLKRPRGLAERLMDPDEAGRLN